MAIHTRAGPRGVAAGEMRQAALWPLLRHRVLQWGVAASALLVLGLGQVWASLSWWSGTDTIPGGEPVSALALARGEGGISGSSTQLVYAGTVYNGIFKSNNGGATWNAANNGYDEGFAVEQLRVDPFSPNVLVALGFDRDEFTSGIFWSDDGADSWLDYTPDFQALDVEWCEIEDAVPVPDWSAFDAIWSDDPVFGELLERVRQEGDLSGWVMLVGAFYGADGLVGNTLFTNGDDAQLVTLSSDDLEFRLEGLAQSSDLPYVAIGGRKPVDGGSSVPVVNVVSPTIVLFELLGGLDDAELDGAAEVDLLLPAGTSMAQLAIQASDDEGEENIRVVALVTDSATGAQAGVYSVLFDPEDYDAEDDQPWQTLAFDRTRVLNVTFADDVSVLALDQSDGTLYVATEADGMHRQSMGETAWTELASAEWVAGQAAALVAGDGKLYAGLIGSSDDDWAVGERAPAEPLGFGVMVSDDQGQTWQPSSTGFPTPALTLSLAAGSAQNQQIVYANGLPGSIYKSVNGAAWQQVYLSPVPQLVLALEVDPRDPNRVYALMSGGALLTSADGGQEWSSIFAAVLGSPFAEGSFVTAMAAGPDGRLYAGVSNWIAETDAVWRWDATQGWSNISGNLAELVPAEGRMVEAIVVDPVFEGRVFAGLSGGRIAYTADAQSWTLLSGGDTNAGISKLAFGGQANKLYALTDMDDSMDASQTVYEITLAASPAWRDLGRDGVPEDSGEWHALVVDAASGAVFVVSERAGILRHESGVWQPDNDGLPSDSQTYALAMDAAARLVVAGTDNAGVFRAELEQAPTAAILTSLALSGGASLQQPFEAARTQYWAIVPHATTQIGVSATAAVPEQTAITIHGEQVSSGQAASVALTEGPNAIRVRAVFQLGGPEVEYTITVTRAPLNPQRESQFTIDGQPVQARLSGGGEQCHIERVSQIVGAPAAPAGYRIAYGTMGFTLAGCTGPVDFSMEFAGALEQGAEYHKAIDGAWVDSTALALPVAISGNTVTVTISDGHPADLSPAGDGRIVDPGAVLVPIAPQPGQTTPVPTLGHLGLVLLAGLLVLFAPLRRKQGAASGSERHLSR